MKIKKGFELRNVAGENILVAVGVDNVDFSKIISMNNAAAYLWREVEARHEFTAEVLAELLTSKYEVDSTTAAKDSASLVEAWLDAGIIEQ